MLRFAGAVTNIPAMPPITLPNFTAPPSPTLPADDLPQPFVAGRAHWRATHDLAWRLAHQHIGHDARLAAPWFMDEACMPDRLWQWDTCFMALYTVYAPDVFPGIQSLDNFYAWQRDDGFISMCTLYADGQPAYGERINPPLLAWVEWEYFRATGDDRRLTRVLSHLVRYFNWIKANRRRPRITEPHQELNPTTAEDDGGLYWETCAGAMGMDNAPRCLHLGWQGSDICFIDLSAQQALAAQCVARIAQHVGDAAVAQRFEREHAELGRLIQRWMWCERDQFFHDIYLDGNFHPSKTVAGFWPLLAGLCSASQAEALLGHLRDPREFWRPHPVPSLAADDPNYCDSGGYWLGGVWAPTNYMIVRGLEQHGFGATAHEIACKHLEALAQVCQTHEPRTLWEAYAPEQITPATRKDKRTWARPDFCGWSALGATAMLYEQVLGLHRDAVTGRLVWDVRLPMAHGCANYPFRGVRLNLSCSEVKAGQRTVTVETPIELTLVLRSGGAAQEISLTPGAQQITLSTDVAG